MSRVFICELEKINSWMRNDSNILRYLNKDDLFLVFYTDDGQMENLSDTQKHNLEEMGSAVQKILLPQGSAEDYLDAILKRAMKYRKEDTEFYLLAMGNDSYHKIKNSFIGCAGIALAKNYHVEKASLYRRKDKVQIAGKENKNKEENCSPPGNQKKRERKSPGQGRESSDVHEMQPAGESPGNQGGGKEQPLDNRNNTQPPGKVMETPEITCPAALPQDTGNPGNPEGGPVSLQGKGSKKSGGRPANPDRPVRRRTHTDERQRTIPGQPSGTDGKNPHKSQPADQARKMPGRTARDVPASIRLAQIEARIFHDALGKDSQTETVYSERDNAKAWVMYQDFESLRHSVLKFMNGFTEETLTDEVFDQLIIVLAKSRDIEDFKRCWKVCEPAFPVSFKEGGDYENLKAEADYCCRLSKMLYREDVFGMFS